MSKKLNGKRALVTAGAQGIGLAISRALLDAGCKVAVHYFSSADTANELKKEYGDNVEVLQADLTDSAQTEAMVGKAVAAMGGMEILINNAGSLIARKRLEEIEISSYLESREWLGKAGGYAIQGLAAAYVRHISGSYSAIVGLPLYETRALLNGSGFRC